MRKLLPLFVFSFFLQPIFAQQDSLLKTFKFRNSNFRAITLNVGAGGSLYSSGYPVNEYSSRAASGNLGGTFYRMRSTDRILQTESTSLYTGFGTNKSDGSNNNFKTTNSSLGYQSSFNNKWFSGTNFFELGTEASLSISASKNTNTDLNTVQKGRSGNQSASIIVGIGKGRLENITDMQNALWLNNTLGKEGRLSRSLSDAELNELGRTITKANNTRVLDFRKRTQFVLETIDSYFQNKGLISKTDISYFSNLNDIVFFAFNDPRLSGTELFARITPGIRNYDQSFTRQPVDLKDKIDATTKSVRFSTGINKYVPVNLQHQNNYGAAIKLSYIANEYSDKEFNAAVLVDELALDATLKQAAIGLFFQHSIYPNTRTIINIRFDGETGYQDIDDETGFFGAAGLLSSVDYFISYRTRFTCGLNLYYQNNVYSINNYLEFQPRTFQLSANAGLQINL
jgi:hypothetical protein